MSDATVKQVEITGVGDVDKLLKVDGSIYEGGGSLGYTTVANVSQSIDDSVTIQGLKGLVNKVGVTASRSGIGNIVSANLGNKAETKTFSIIKPVNDSTFTPYLLSDIIAALPSVVGDVELQGYDLYVEEYAFSGKVIDGLNDLAGLIYGTVVYNSEEDKHYIVGGDTNYTPPGNSGGSYTPQVDDLISYEVVTIKNSKLSSFGTQLINAAKELARLRAAILDLPPTTATDNADVKELQTIIDFDFGTKGSNFTPIPKEIRVDSTNWDEWYYDALNNRYTDANSSNKFISKLADYYKVETLEECAIDAQGGVAVTTKRGKQRGLRSIDIGTKLMARLPIPANSTIYGKGYVANLDSLGLPSLVKYKYDAQQSGQGQNTPYEDCYHSLYDVEYVTIAVKAGQNSTAVVNETVPYLTFKTNVMIRNATWDALSAQATATGAPQPTQLQLDEAMQKHQYVVKVEIMGISTSYNLKYKGWLDSRGRLISDSGQVQLIYGGSDMFYGPLDGMDTSFITTATPLPQSTQAASSILDDYIAESAIKSSLESAYTDLKTLCTQQTAIGKYAATPIGQAPSTTYPKIIYEHIANPVSGGPTTGNAIGVVFGVREPTTTLTLSEYTSSDKKKKQLERKVKCVESKIQLIINCIKHNDPSNTISKQTVKDYMKTIIKYDTILSRVKNESIATMVGLKTEYENALNGLLTSCDGTSSGKIKRATVTTIIPESLPALGSSLSIGSVVTGENGAYKIVSVNVSDVTATIVGEYNV